MEPEWLFHRAWPASPPATEASSPSAPPGSATTSAPPSSAAPAEGSAPTTTAIATATAAITRMDASALPLAIGEQEEDASPDRDHTRPDRDLDPLLLVHAQGQGTELGFVAVLGEREPPVHEGEHAGHDEHESDDLLHVSPRGGGDAITRGRGGAPPRPGPAPAIRRGRGSPEPGRPRPPASAPARRGPGPRTSGGPGGSCLG